MSCLRYEISSGGLGFHQLAGSSLHFLCAQRISILVFRLWLNSGGAGFGADFERIPESFPILQQTLLRKISQGGRLHFSGKSVSLFGLMFGLEPSCLRKGRGLLVLGRVSNLPTVWSNCLAAFLLSEGDSRGDLAFLMLGASLFYLGGMYLNDAFDAGFDHQFRKERPIPSGTIREKTVWILGGLQLALGFVCFSIAVAGRVPYSLSILLGASILVYNAAHKAISWSPILMALCRFVLFLAVASNGQDGIAWFLAVDSTEQDGIAGRVLWSAIALSCYIVGLSCVARRESGGGFLSWWPCLLLSFPAVLAFLVNNGDYRGYGIAAILAYIGWTLFCLRDIYWKAQPDIGRGVSRLLAGIVLVDLMSIDLTNAGQVIFMVGLFGAALFLQKFIPAT